MNKQGLPVRLKNFCNVLKKQLVTAATVFVLTFWLMKKKANSSLNESVSIHSERSSLHVDARFEKIYSLSFDMTVLLKIFYLIPESLN
jgi:hypothetical protein